MVHIDDLADRTAGPVGEMGTRVQCGQTLKSVVAIAPIEIVGVGGVALPWALACLPHLGVKSDEPFRFGKRQGPQKNAVYQAVYGGGRSYAESECQHSGHCEARRFAKLAKGKMKIGTERGEH
jgi:hypothetical protein